MTNVENPERLHQKNVRINKFNKVTKYKINKQNRLHLYILITSIQKSKIPRSKFNQGGEKPVH